MSRKTCTVLLTACLCALLQPCFAHDPGLSFLKVELDDHRVKLEFIFARADLESLIKLDRNQDLQRNQIEQGAQQKLHERLINGVILSNGQEVISADELTIVPAPSKTIKANLIYTTQSHNNLSLAIPLLSRFARGHRQHLSVRDKNGNQMVQKILSKQSGVVKIQVAEISMLAVFKQYFTEGVWHIWIGFDHILFLLTLLLPAVMVYRQHRWQSVAKLLPAITDTLKIITAFTVAHSITLALAVLKIVQLPSRDVEIVIALSVLITAVNNLIPVFCRYRWLLAFGFGLIHGFGFASVLNNLGLEPHSIVSSLIGFNLGVEFGQLVIVCLFLPFAFMASHTLIYRQWVLNGGSILAGIVACIWIVERVTDVELFGGVGLFLN